MKITKQTIETIAKTIINELVKRNLDINVSLYYNNKRVSHIAIPVIEPNINPLDYFEYVAEKHILSMSFEGALYTEINYGDGAPWLQQLLDTYGLYYELGNAWNLTVYPVDDKMYDDIEYTYYTKKPYPVTLVNPEECDVPELQNIMLAWHELSRLTGDVGSCVLGAGFAFTYQDISYFMTAQSPYQGSMSWESHKYLVKQMLENIGCKDISYDCGSID